jgi:hypothetical protein
MNHVYQVHAIEPFGTLRRPMAMMEPTSSSSPNCKPLPVIEMFRTRTGPTSVTSGTANWHSVSALTGNDALPGDRSSRARHEPPFFSGRGSSRYSDYAPGRPATIAWAPPRGPYFKQTGERRHHHQDEAFPFRVEAQPAGCKGDHRGAKEPGDQQSQRDERHDPEHQDAEIAQQDRGDIEAFRG